MLRVGGRDGTRACFQSSPWPSRPHITLRCLLLLPLLAVAVSAHGALPPLVHTSCGSVHGVIDPASGAAAFLGIPYASPPVGLQRWQPPRGTCWGGDLNAVSPGPSCLQAGEYAKHGVATSEDCLRLHVHTNNLGKNDGLRPVLVWLHGGGLLEGSPFTLQSGFGAQVNLTVENEVIVVSVQYRLGIAGFLALDALAREHDPRGVAGNYGLLDCLEALRWIQRHITNFGGDPSRVTVWGQSSGGSLVFALLASPTSRGLLHGGISMSGSPRLNSTVEEAGRYWHRRVVERTPCIGIGFEQSAARRLVDCLLNITEEQLLKSLPPEWAADVWSLAFFQQTWQYAPILLIDGPGGVLPQSYLDAFASNRASASAVALPSVVIGATRQESDFSPGDDVRNFTALQLAAFLRAKLQDAGQQRDFVNEMLAVYSLPSGDDGVVANEVHAASVSEGINSTDDTFEAQRVYAEILSDATTVCPNIYLGTWMGHGGASDNVGKADIADVNGASFAGASGADRGNQPSHVYTYAASRPMDNPFCVLRPFSHLDPPYCPRYAFHAVDEFAMIRPAYSADRFPYRLSAGDVASGQRLWRRLREFVVTGAVADWPSIVSGVSRRSSIENPDVDAETSWTRRSVVAHSKESDEVARELPAEYTVVDMGNAERIIPGYLRQRCNFWLGRGFYDSRGLINFHDGNRNKATTVV